jgi:hypothetical protein
MNVNDQALRERMLLKMYKLKRGQTIHYCNECVFASEFEQELIPVTVVNEEDFRNKERDQVAFRKANNIYVRITNQQPGNMKFKMCSGELFPKYIRSIHTTEKLIL